MILALLVGLALGADDRDDDIFGTPSDPPAPPPETRETPPDTTPGLGGPLTSDRDIAARLGLAEQRLTFGGLGFLRLDGTVAKGDDASTAGLASPSFVDLFADARPNDRLRLYLRSRLYHDLTLKAGDTDAFGNEVQPTRVALDQLWLNFDVARRVFVTAGRQRVKWGVGRLWNPTDFLAPSALDGLAVFDERMGVGLIKVHVPIEKTSTNVYAFAVADGARHPDEVGGALRVEQLLGPVEVAVSGSVRKDQPQQLGAQVSFPVWLFDVKGELAVRHGGSASRWEGAFDPANLVFPTEIDRSDDWIPQALGGLELGLRYSDQDSIYIGAEYLFNDAGYDGAELYPWLIANGQFTPFYLGRHYVAAYVLLPAIGPTNDHTVSVTGIANLSDGTMVGRADWRVNVLTLLAFNAYAQVHGGKEGGEFAFAVSIPPIPGVFPDGVTVPRPLVDVGVGAQLRF